jgi:outer membrane protein OmpA-like peptidoglycan-associated protein
MRARWLGLLGLVAALAACGGIKDNLVVVVPGADGHVGAVTVTDAGGQTVLDQPYAAVTAGRGATRTARVAVDEAQVAAIFGPARAALPRPPMTFRLYFLSDTNQLTPDSLIAFEAVFTEIARRPAADTVVTGHTDTAGSDAYNDRLALDRATVVREMMIVRGLTPDGIAVAARGKRELLVPTPDQTHEPRNRRVEITVR